MDYKLFFKIDKYKILLSILLIFILPVVNSQPNYCSASYCQHSPYGISFPIKGIISEYLASPFHKLSAFKVQLGLYFENLLFSGTFVLNILFAYPIACWLIYYLQMIIEKIHLKEEN